MKGGKNEYSSRANLVENEGRNEDREVEEAMEDKKRMNMDISPSGGGLGPPVSG